MPRMAPLVQLVHLKVTSMSDISMFNRGRLHSVALDPDLWSMAQRHSELKLPPHRHPIRNRILTGTCLLTETTIATRQG